MRNFVLDQRLRNDADHFAARLERSVGERAHQADRRAAIDKGQAAFGNGATG